MKVLGQIFCQSPFIRSLLLVLAWIIDAKIINVEQIDTFQFSFIGDPVVKVTVIGFGVYSTGNGTDVDPRFTVKIFTNVSDIQGIAYKTLLVSDAYQQFSVFVTPRTKAFHTVI